MSTLLISEQDKLNILKQYGLLAEQDALSYPHGKYNSSTYGTKDVEPSFTGGLEILEKACYVGMFLGAWGMAICSAISIIKGIADKDKKQIILQTILLAFLYRAKIITGVIPNAKKLVELSKMIKTGKPQTVVEENILKTYNKSMPNIITYIKNVITKDIHWFKELLWNIGIIFGVELTIDDSKPELPNTKSIQTNFKYTKNNPLVFKNDNFSYYADGYDNNKNLKVFTKKNNTNNWIEVAANTAAYNSIINKYGKYLKEKNEQA